MNTIVSRLRAATALCLAQCALCIPASAAWTYNASAKTLTESVTEGTAWVLNLTVSGNEATVKSVKTVGTTNYLDLASAAESDSPPIVALADSAFNAKTTLISITLPDTLRSIGQYAFYKCTALTNVTPFLPASVTSRIGHGRGFLCVKSRKSNARSFGRITRFAWAYPAHIPEVCVVIFFSRIS